VDSTLGDAATWVLAVGTLGTFYVSLRLLRRAAEDRRVEQARLVSAWLGDTRHEPDGWALTYTVRNNSEEPVYEVILNAMCGVRGTFVRWLGTLGPAERRRVTILLPGFSRKTQEHMGRSNSTQRCTSIVPGMSFAVRG
jgi:hypothetical protein